MRYVPLFLLSPFFCRELGVRGRLGWSTPRAAINEIDDPIDRDSSTAVDDGHCPVVAQARQSNFDNHRGFSRTGMMVVVIVDVTANDGIVRLCLAVLARDSDRSLNAAVPTARKQSFDHPAIFSADVVRFTPWLIFPTICPSISSTRLSSSPM
jgi:hypothetical protein